MRIASAGHAVFAAAMVAVGVVGLIKEDLSAVRQMLPKGVPATVLAYFCALTCIGSESGVLLAAACVLYVWFAADWDKQRLGFATGDKGLRIARALYGAAIIPFGLAHFQYVEHTASMVPSWLPMRVTWAYFTGAAFIVAGAAILIGVCARLAAALSALQMGLFLVLVWVPAMATRSLNSFQWGEVLATWVLTAAAWVVTDSYRGISWLALDKPLVLTLRQTR